jgi:cell wall-associated NlpC family hydrolase
VPSLRSSCRATVVLAATAALACGMTPVLTASAKPVYPSAKEVQDAKAAASGKAGQVAAAQAQYAAASARLAEVQAQAEMAAERYNGARVLLQQRTDAARSASRQASAAGRTAQVASDKVGQLAAQAYMQGGGSFSGLETILSSKGPQEVIDRASGMAVVSDLRTQVLQEASATSVVAGVLQRQAARAQAQQLAAAQAAETARAQAQSMADAAQAQTAAIQRQQAQLVAQLATLQHTSVALEGRRQAGLKAEAEARAAAAAKAAAERRAREAARQAAARQAAAREAAAREAAAREAASRQRQQRYSTRHQAPAPAPVVVAPPAPAPVDPPARRSGGVGAVLAFAQAQMGEPYVWGAEGPGAWDCSGLTMKAWQQAGVYLSHYTGFQWAETRHLPISARQPGDLIFYGVSGAASHHVGLYIGGDQMIEAPHTGANVRVSTIWRPDIIMEVGRP